MSKIAISSDGPGLTSMVDPRFGRAGGFVVHDTANSATSYIDNGASQVLGQGAGIATAERMAEENVEIVLSGYVGPKAFQALQAAGIKVCQNVDGMTTGDALKHFQAGNIPFAEAANR